MATYRQNITSWLVTKLGTIKTSNGYNFTIGGVYKFSDIPENFRLLDVGSPILVLLLPDEDIAMQEANWTVNTLVFQIEIWLKVVDKSTDAANEREKIIQDVRKCLQSDPLAQGVVTYIKPKLLSTCRGLLAPYYWAVITGEIRYHYTFTNA